MAGEDDDYYRILGVSKDVSDDGLKRAYKRQALKWHPDKNQHRPAQAAERFKKVSEAYQTLSNKKSKAAYNRRRRTIPGTHCETDEVLFSKTYGWPGVNISFYWTEKPPAKEEQQPAQAKTQTEESPQASSRSPLELFKDMFEMDSPLAAIDKQLRRGSSGSIFESVFGSFKSFDTEEDACRTPPESATPPESSTPPMSARQRKMAIIEEEYAKGDLTEAEYQKLVAIFNDAAL